MPEKIKDLRGFIFAVVNLLDVINRSSSVLFRYEFRTNLANSLEEVIPRLQKLSEENYIKYPDDVKEMRLSGLSGNQLMLKLESFENSLAEFEIEGGVDNLELALDKGEAILSSLAGAIPGFGSFAQELVDFILKELKKRFKFWKK